jgi:hypothetical protein
MVMPTTCLAIQIGFARRGRWWKTLECLGIFVEGFCSLVVFFIALVSPLPLHLYHDPLKGIGLGEFLQQLVCLPFYFVQLPIGLLEEGVKLVHPLFKVPVLADSCCEERVSVVKG